MALTLKPILNFPLFTPPPSNHHHHHHHRHPTTIIRLSKWNNPNFLKHTQHHHKHTQKQLEDHSRLLKRFHSANNITNTTPTPITTPPPPFKSTGTPSSPSLPSIPGKKSKYSKPHHNNIYNKFIKVPNFPQQSQQTGSRFIKVRSFPQDIHQETHQNQETDSRFIKDSNFIQEIHQESQETQETGSRFIKDSNFIQGIHQESQETQENQENGSRFMKVRNFTDFTKNPDEKNADLQNPDAKNHNSHPAFKKFVKVRNFPKEIEDGSQETGIKVTDNGVKYVIPEAPFEFQYSYTETPKVKPVRLREEPILPFGPGTRARPWTGKKPLPKGKKVEFDSFVLPPVGKKGVKPVQAPGPFLGGAGPKYVKDREEVLGEPLSKEEVDALVKGCLKSSRQLNMGRDGFTHNMLDNIHAHWKRRRVCKIKCKGVCTVDMDNVRHQLEEKTGGKVIYSKGGVVYLFRGRNYNYKTRPVFPLMLWKPVTPVYPRLIQRVPEGLTLEEASEMRKKGRQLTPICKLGKNGVYCDLVNNIREAFEACDLVRINCEGMNGSDYRKIGAKLKDLVPCVLISFEHEHILMWRGQNWKSMFPEENKPREAMNPDTDSEHNEIEASTPDNTDDDETDNTDDDETVSDDDKSIKHVDIENNVSEDASSQDSLTGVMSLLKQAVQDGIAFVLEDSHMDADEVYAKAVAFSKSAQPGPTFRLQRAKRAVTTPTENQEGEETVENEVVSVSVPKKGGKSKNLRTRKKDTKENYLDIVPQSTLRVDELAKLLG